MTKSRNKNRKRDISILLQIRDKQNELLNELQFFGVKRVQDLSPSDRMRPSVRRGLVQMVGDIFELTNGLRDETKEKLGLNLMVIKHFRNSASHNYGILSNEMAYACISHCISKELRQNVLREFEILQTELNKNKK